MDPNTQITIQKNKLSALYKLKCTTRNEQTKLQRQIDNMNNELKKLQAKEKNLEAKIKREQEVKDLWVMKKNMMEGTPLPTAKTMSVNTPDSKTPTPALTQTPLIMKTPITNPYAKNKTPLSQWSVPSEAHWSATSENFNVKEYDGAIKEFEDRVHNKPSSNLQQHLNFNTEELFDEDAFDDDSIDYDALEEIAVKHTTTRKTAEAPSLPLNVPVYNEKVNDETQQTTCEELKIVEDNASANINANKSTISKPITSKDDEENKDRQGAGTKRKRATRSTTTVQDN